MKTDLQSPCVRRDGETLYSEQFDDIYYQPHEGLAETQHVFLDGNDLPDRFARLRPNEHFVIGELGLGTGLNLLAALCLFQETAPAGARLHLWSCEIAPFSQDEFRSLIDQHVERWPTLREAGELIKAAYPKPRPGLAQRSLGSIGTLTIWFGDAGEGLRASAFLADSWFLDGFAPSTNETMWSDDIFAAIGKRTIGGGSAATFTVAGKVRRGLIGAGFDVDKSPGFGRKREMVRAQYRTGPARPTPRKIAIAGAGIAGAALAMEAQSAGLEPVVYDPHGPAAGASGNPAGLIMPRIDALKNPQAVFYRDAFLFSRAVYRDLSPPLATAMEGEIRTPTQKAAARAEKASRNGLWDPADWHSGSDKIVVPDALLVRPADIVHHWLDEIDLVRDAVHLSPDGTFLAGDEWLDADIIGIATGPVAAALYPSIAPDLLPSRGQVDLFSSPRINHILTEGGYAAPFGEGLIAGATYAQLDQATPVKPDTLSTQSNQKTAEHLVGEPVGEAIGARASLRGTTPDRHPLFAMVPPPGEPAEQTQILLSGLGSRGLSTAPLLARAALSRTLALPTPVTSEGETLLRADRFTLRRQRRQDEKTAP
ncbi:MAG: tRNA (5-methylaminomethyl-2-thiouridine)(34)-methyltransferase MnmD [Parvularcula sp.]